MPIYRPATNRARTASVAALAVLFVITAYGFAASAWLAEKLGYVPALGRPWLDGLYSPFAWITWSFRYYHDDPTAFAQVYWFFVVIAVFALGAAVVTLGLTTRRLPTYTDVQGSARFIATTDEIRKAGLLPPAGREHQATGVLLALWPETIGWLWKRTEYQYLRHAQIEHIQLFGPPGSGKGVAFVYNAINTWDSSMVILDRKGSLHQMTSGYLSAAGWRVLRWAPLDPANSIGINILDTIRRGDHEVGDAINFAKALIPTEGNNQNQFFTDAASRLLASVVLYVIYKVGKAHQRPATLADLVKEFGSASESTTKLYKALHENTLLPGNKPHEWISDMGSMALKGAKSERTDANIFETAFQKLLAATDPLVQRATRDSHFQFDDLMNGEQKIALFLVVPPSESDLQRLSGIFTTLLSMMIEVPTRRPILPEKGKTKIPHARPLMLLLDEIGNVGRINSLPGALTQLREYGVKIIGIWQSYTQIIQHYGPNNPILGASEIQMSFAPNDQATADWLSARLGDTTAAVQNTQMSGQRFALGMHNVNASIDHRPRKLMTPEETMRLPGPTKDDNNMITSPGEILVMKRGEHAIRGVQALWWTIPGFAGRADLPPVQTADSRAPAHPQQMAATSQSAQTAPAPAGGGAAAPYKAPTAAPRRVMQAPSVPPATGGLAAQSASGKERRRPDAAPA